MALLCNPGLVPTSCSAGADLSYHLERQETVSRTGLVTNCLPPYPSQEQAELKIRGRELKAKEEQLARDRELLDEAWHELRLEKEKVKGAALRIRQREEEIKSVNKVSGAPELRFAAAHGLAAKPGHHTPPEVVHPSPVLGGE